MALDESSLLAITVGVMGALGLTYLYNKHENKPQSGGSRRRRSSSSKKSRRSRK